VHSLPKEAGVSNWPSKESGRNTKGDRILLKTGIWST